MITLCSSFQIWKSGNAIWGLRVWNSALDGASSKNVCFYSPNERSFSRHVTFKGGQNNHVLLWLHKSLSGNFEIEIDLHCGALFNFVQFHWWILRANYAMLVRSVFGVWSHWMIYSTCDLYKNAMSITCLHAKSIFVLLFFSLRNHISQCILERCIKTKVHTRPIFDFCQGSALRIFGRGWAHGMHYPCRKSRA